jgi:hypothetical protein
MQDIRTSYKTDAARYARGSTPIDYRGPKRAAKQIHSGPAIVKGRGAAAKTVRA